MINHPEIQEKRMSMVGTAECRKTILEKYPEKTAQLTEYLDSLPLNDSIPKRRGLLIQSLHKAQKIFGYLPLEVQEFVGNKLGLMQSDVYGVISFYSYFTDQPVGKYKVNVCTGTACFVKGANKILSEFESHLGIKLEQTTADGKFSLCSLRCIGACSLAPVVMVNEEVYANVTPDMVKKIIKECE